MEKTRPTLDLVMEDHPPSHTRTPDEDISPSGWPWPDIPETYAPQPQAPKGRNNGRESFHVRSEKTSLHVVPQEVLGMHRSIPLSTLDGLVMPEQGGQMVPRQRTPTMSGPTATDQKAVQSGKRSRFLDALYFHFPIASALMVLSAGSIMLGSGLALTFGPQYRRDDPPATLEDTTASDLLRDGDPQMLLHGEGGKHLQITIPLSYYLDYKRRDHVPFSVEGYARFVTPDDPYIQQLARHLTRGSDTGPERANAIFLFMREYVYLRDPRKDQDYAKYPIETLVERGGDCEDLSILAASLLLAAGQDVILLDHPNHNHISLAIAGDYSGSHVVVDGRNYYIVEPQVGDVGGVSMGDVGDMRIIR